MLDAMTRVRPSAIWPLVELATHMKRRFLEIDPFDLIGDPSERTECCEWSVFGTSQTGVRHPLNPAKVHRILHLKDVWPILRQPYHPPESKLQGSPKDCRTSRDDFPSQSSRRPHRRTRSFSSNPTAPDVASHSRARPLSKPAVE